ncbi:FAD-dependent monooxygenase [Glacieibacterium frigidum]|uniref:Salicylate 1-monooxygenase n=1 Tax=Glacieibacterium frigidum TaxID=2593303 RepID=A0A552U8B7_9SPHN|nr:FAD-dependent monooxygenase [Glacieibacterium frigidum]TRW14429.1 salicylate 1-monooxygenase [Glacieibacterium frigidum]
MRVLIAGGGIGGLTAAIALLRHGFEVDVFEAAPAFADIGAGVTLAPNAMTAFAYLGVADAIAAQSVEPTRQQVRHWQDGRVLMTLDRGTRMRDLYGAPYLYTHRADLHAILVDAVAANGGRLHCGAAVVAAGIDGDEARVTLSDGGVVGGELVVGADGLKSVVRQLFDPAPAHFTGHVAWRALVPVDAALRDLADNPGNFIGPGRLAVWYPLRGGSLLNLVFFGRQAGWSDEGWTIPARRAELEALFAGWNDTLQLLIARTDEARLFKWAINARAPLTRWTIGDRITLLGDAAHAMTPFMGQGASSAIEDAVVLARALAAAGTRAEGLARYEAARIERTSMIQLESNANADRLQGSDADLFGMTKLRNEETLGLFAYDAGTVTV